MWNMNVKFNCIICNSVLHTSNLANNRLETSDWKVNDISGRRFDVQRRSQRVESMVYGVEYGRAKNNVEFWKTGCNGSIAITLTDCRYRHICTSNRLTPALIIGRCLWLGDSLSLSFPLPPARARFRSYICATLIACLSLYTGNAQYGHHRQTTLLSFRIRSALALSCIDHSKIGWSWKDRSRGCCSLSLQVFYCVLNQ